MDFERALVSDQCSTILEASKLVNSHCALPELQKYFCEKSSDIEIQQFNLFGKIPHRLTNEEDIAMWLLETDSLNRERVSHYLTLSTYDELPRRCLAKLAAKICALDVGKSFVNGLKFFIPVVGCWDPSSEELQVDSPILRMVLEDYITAHLIHSKTPIFPNICKENLSTMLDITMCILQVCKVIVDGSKSSSNAMADFFAALKMVMQKQQKDLAKQQYTTFQQQQLSFDLSMKVMTDLFVATTTGSPLLTVLHIPAGTSSCLFANIKMQGALTVGFTLEAALQPVYALCCDDALYLFSCYGDNDLITATMARRQRTCGNAATVPPNSRLLACIPLAAVRIHSQDDIAHSNLLELISIGNKEIPYIEYYEKQPIRNNTGMSNHMNSSSILLPHKVVYHEKIFIHVNSITNFTETMATSSTNASAVSSVAADALAHVHDWMDAIENSCWEGRSS